MRLSTIDVPLCESSHSDVIYTDGFLDSTTRGQREGRAACYAPRVEIQLRTSRTEVRQTRALTSRMAVRGMEEKRRRADERSVCCRSIETT